MRCLRRMVIPSQPAKNLKPVSRHQCVPVTKEDTDKRTYCFFSLAIKAPVQRAQHAHISARAPSMQKHRRESTIRRVPRIEAPENTPDKQSDIEPASDNELLIVSLGRSKKSSQAATHQHRKLSYPNPGLRRPTSTAKLINPLASCRRRFGGSRIRGILRGWILRSRQGFR